MSTFLAPKRFNYKGLGSLQLTLNEFNYGGTIPRSLANTNLTHRLLAHTFGFLSQGFDYVCISVVLYLSWGSKNLFIEV